MKFLISYVRALQDEGMEEEEAIFTIERIFEEKRSLSSVESYLKKEKKELILFGYVLKSKYFANIKNIFTFFLVQKKP